MGEAEDFRNGDFVGLKKEVAERHLRNKNDKIWSKKVDIDDLVQGADQFEFIYAPKKITEQIASTTKLQAKIKKLYSEVKDASEYSSSEPFINRTYKEIYKLESQLTDIYNKAKTKEVVKPKAKVIQSNPLEAKVIQKTTPSPHAVKIREGLIEKGLAKDMEGVAEFTPTTIKEQSKIFSPIVEDKERFKRILRGGEELPKGAKSGAVKTAVDASKDPELMRLYTNSEYASNVSEAGSNLGIMQRNNPESGTSKMKDIKNIKEKAFEKKKGKISKAVNKEKVAIKDKIKKQAKPTKETWNSFISEIKC